MCGRYSLFIDDDYFEALELYQRIREFYPDLDINVGEIVPSNTVPIIAKDDIIKPKAAVWGLKTNYNSRLLINTRAETAETKSFFKESFERHRCLIPCTGFYEWNTEKRKYFFTLPENKLFYMAGLYIKSNELLPRFSIITTAANPSVGDIHSRMPLIIEKSDCKSWLSDTMFAKKLLSVTPPLLERAEA